MDEESALCLRVLQNQQLRFNPICITISINMYKETIYSKANKQKTVFQNPKTKNPRSASAYDIFKTTKFKCLMAT